MKKVNKISWRKKSLITFLFIVLIIVLYLVFLKPIKTGDDLMGSDLGSQYLSDNQSNDNLSKSSSIFDNSEGKDNETSAYSSSGGKYNPKDFEEYVRPTYEINSGDSDAFELSGEIITLNFWQSGVCKDEYNPAGLFDECSNGILTEYYLENEKCISYELNCITSLVEYYPENTEFGCYKESCILKSGGMDFQKKGYLLSDEALAKWDECLDEDILREHYIQNGIPFEVNISCREIYGIDSKCEDGACIEINLPEILPEEFATDSDGLDFSKIGTCQNKTGSYTDYCTDYGSLIEYMVDPENQENCKEVDTYCPYGICIMGWCAPWDLDSSSDNQYKIKSNCSDETQNLEDTCYCLNDGTPCYNLRERILVNSTCQSEIINCSEMFGTGYLCSDGECVYQGRVTR